MGLQITVDGKIIDIDIVVLNGNSSLICKSGTVYGYDGTLQNVLYTFNAGDTIGIIDTYVNNSKGFYFGIQPKNGIIDFSDVYHEDFFVPLNSSSGSVTLSNLSDMALQTQTVNSQNNPQPSFLQQVEKYIPWLLIGIPVVAIVVKRRAKNKVGDIQTNTADILLIGAGGYILYEYLKKKGLINPATTNQVTSSDSGITNTNNQQPQTISPSLPNISYNLTHKDYVGSF